MGELTGAFHEFEERLVRWGEQHPDVRALIVIGSRARTHRPADEWSDMDVWMLVTDAEPFIASREWLDALGEVWLTFVEPTPDGESERRALFDGGVDVDFVPISVVEAQRTLDNEIPLQLADLLQRGFRVLVDKEGLAKRLKQIPLRSFPRRLPSESEFQNVVSDFWYHVVWTAKKLKRGELWTALGCLDSYLMWRCILPMLEWHAVATRGSNHDVWFRGRFLEQWADPRVVDDLSRLFARYDRDEAWQTLFAMMDFFRRLATDTAAKAQIAYPSDGDARVTEWVRQVMQQ